MSYETYKILHVVLALLFVSSSAALLHGPRERWCSAFHGLVSLLILVAGMGLAARTGLANPASWPSWLWIKVLLWALASAASVVGAKRFRDRPKAVSAAVLGLASLAVVVAVTRP